MLSNTHMSAGVVRPLMSLLQVLCAGSSKVACDYSNRLCQWNASYAFGAAVLGDLVGADSDGVNQWLLAREAGDTALS